MVSQECSGKEVFDHQTTNSIRKFGALDSQRRGGGGGERRMSEDAPSALTISEIEGEKFKTSSVAVTVCSEDSGKKGDFQACCVSLVISF